VGLIIILSIEYYKYSRNNINLDLSEEARSAW